MIAIDDNFDEHPKFVSLSNDATALWVRCLGYCRRNRTDGFIPEEIALMKARCKTPKKVIAELTSSPKAAPGKTPLWEVVPGGYQVHDYLAGGWNLSRAELEQRAEQKRASARLGGLASGKARSKQPAQPESNQKGTGDEAPCFDSGSTKTNPTPDPLRSADQILSETQSLPVCLENSNTAAAGVESNHPETASLLQLHRMTKHLAADERSVGLIAMRAFERGLSLEGQRAAIAWASERLEVESVALGGGQLLTLEATLDKIMQGLKGEATKRKRLPPSSAEGEPSAVPQASAETLARLKERVLTESGRALAEASDGKGMRW